MVPPPPDTLAKKRLLLLRIAAFVSAGAQPQVKRERSVAPGFYDLPEMRVTTKNSLAGMTIFALTVVWVIALVRYEAKTPRPANASTDAMANRGGGGFPFDDFGPGPGGPPGAFGGPSGGGPARGGSGNAGPARNGGGGPGTMLAAQIVLHADADQDGKLTPAEFTALAETWFDKLDTDRSGQLSAQSFADRLNDFLSTPPAAHPRGGGLLWGGGGYGRGIARALFTAADTNQDGSLSRDELHSAFAKWSVDWDKDTNASLDESELRTGFNSILPHP